MPCHHSICRMRCSSTHSNKQKDNTNLLAPSPLPPLQHLQKDANNQGRSDSRCLCSHIAFGPGALTDPRSTGEELALVAFASDQYMYSSVGTGSAQTCAAFCHASLCQTHRTRHTIMVCLPTCLPCQPLPSYSRAERLLMLSDTCVSSSPSGASNLHGRVEPCNTSPSLGVQAAIHQL